MRTFILLHATQYMSSNDAYCNGRLLLHFSLHLILFFAFSLQNHQKYSFFLLSHLAAFSFLETLYILEERLHIHTHMHTNTHAHTHTHTQL